MMGKFLRYKYTKFQLCGKIVELKPFKGSVGGHLEFLNSLFVGHCYYHTEFQLNIKNKIKSLIYSIILF